MNDQIAYTACDDVGLRVRINDLVPGTLDRWCISLANCTTVLTGIAAALETLLRETETIDEIAAFSRHPAFERHRLCKAQALYLLGRQAEARAVFEVLFSGEPDFRRANSIMRRLGLGAVADLS